MNHKGISVVIPNFNGKYLLEQILPPLYEALKNTSLDHEVIISDDHSTDDSVNFLKENYPGQALLESTENKGFSPTINKGIFLCRFDYILLLNSDVKLEPAYFKTLLPYFDLPDTFGVMGRIVDWDGDNIQDGGKYPYFHGTKIKTSGNYIPLIPDYSQRLYTMYLSGANAMVCRKKLWELGGFDELYAPFYVEDYDLSLRAWRMGYKCYYDHFAVCRHKVSVSIRSQQKENQINKIYYRNKMYLHAIHLSGIKRYLWYVQSLLEVVMQIFLFHFYYAKALALFYGSHKLMLNSRDRFLTLSKKNKTKLSLKDVVEKITIFLQPLKIRKF